MVTTVPLLLSVDDQPDGMIDVVSPFNGAAIATVATCSMGQVSQSLEVAHKLYRDRGAWLSLTERLNILKKAAEQMTEKAEALTHQAALEGGKPLQDSRVEVNRAIDGIHLCIEHIRTEQGEVVPLNTDNRLAFTRKEPIGVVVAVSAFNHPLNLIVHQVAAAIAAGCPVIVKPSEETPLSCVSFVEILRQAGLPDDWCQVAIPSSREISEALVTDPRVAFFSFIGSARVGWMLRSKLAPGTRCALEHGGVAPVILAEDFETESTVASLLKGGFYHAGQVCVSVQRIFVPRSRLDELVAGLAAGAEALIVGDPNQEATQVGPLIRPAEVERVNSWVEEAIDHGATLAAGGKAISDTCYAPTVLVNPRSADRISTSEVFGPVVCVYAYDEIDQAIAQANSLDVAFQAAVFTQNLDRALEISSKLDASAVMINDHTAFRVDGMPFAGLRHSGLGVGGIPHTIDDMQIDKMTVINSPGITI